MNQLAQTSKFEIRDGAGRRMVHGRMSSGAAIDVITKACAGFGNFPADRRECWIHLRDQLGYQVVEVAPLSWPESKDEA